MHKPPVINPSAQPGVTLALSYTLEGGVDLDEGEGRVTLFFRFMF